MDGTLKKKWKKARGKMISRIAGLLSQEEQWDGTGEVRLCEGLPGLTRAAAAEGAVLLKNDGVLPLPQDCRVSVFGRVQIDYFAVGYGSGGDVKTPYVVGLLQGLRENEGVCVNEQLAAIYEDWCKNNPVDHGYWGNWPRFHEEMPLDSALVQEAAQHSDVALVVLGRAAGEDRENVLEPGSYNLTSSEAAMLDAVCAAFSRVAVVIDSGNLLDLSWMNHYGDRIGALLFAWQGGMESGRAVADVLSGAVNPSGRLTDSIAKHYGDYPSAANFGGKEFNNYAEDIYVGYRYFETFAPDRVLYPFGFGLSYTDFDIQVESFGCEHAAITLQIEVRNTGARAGKEVVQVYYGAPQGTLGKAAKSLCAFAKTPLLQPGASCNLTLSFPASAMASFDDSGASGHLHAFVLEAGEYPVYVGNNVRDTVVAGSYRQSQTAVISQLSDSMGPNARVPFSRIRPADSGVMSYEPVPVGTRSLKQRILERLPREIPMTGDRGITLADVASGRASMEDFVAQLSGTELEAISRGDYVMNSKLGPKGNAGVLGGVLESLRGRGVVPVTTTDGPSGIRLHAFCSLLPCGTLLACTWDTELVRALYEKMGAEMIDKGTDVLLAPGMNLHRDPLCGRNFEYFSEDPLVSGRMAAATVRGLQSQGVSACPKHFACNNQETNRIRNDSRVSQRALRELYLKSFEICIQESNPHNIMTSYNKVNGVWSHYNYDLCTTVLRGEWGYEGNVVTDWWMRSSRDPDFPLLRDNAYRVRAQVDVLMPGGKFLKNAKPDGTLLESLGKPEGITLGELQRTAMNVLRFVLRSHKFCAENGLASGYTAPPDSVFTVSIE